MKTKTKTKTKTKMNTKRYLCVEGLDKEVLGLGAAAGLKRHLQNEQRVRLLLTPKHTRHQVCLFDFCRCHSEPSRPSLLPFTPATTYQFERHLMLVYSVPDFVVALALRPGMA